MTDNRNTVDKAPVKLTERSGLPRKARGADLRKDYRLTMQSSMVTALLVLIGLFHMSFETGDEFEIEMVEQEIVEMEEIQQTQQVEQPPPPPRPPVPIEVPNEEILEDVVLDLDASLDLDAPVQAPPPPPPAKEEEEEEAEQEIFVVVEEMPEIVGGTARLHEIVRYPDLARQAGVEGLVVVKVVVEPDGSPSNPEVIRSAGNLLDTAAVEAVMKLSFTPGKQRGQPVRVSFAVPVRFRLRDAG
ncbi:MAG: energy transducer TonB [Bacteroidota bacterium]